MSWSYYITHSYAIGITRYCPRKELLIISARNVVDVKEEEVSELISLPVADPTLTITARDFSFLPLLSHACPRAPTTVSRSRFPSFFYVDAKVRNSHAGERLFAVKGPLSITDGYGFKAEIAAVIRQDLIAGSTD